FEDLRGKRVAVVNGFFQQEYMQRKYPETELVLGEDILDSIYAVLEGRADALVSSFSSTKYLIDQHTLIGLRFAVISRDPELLSTNALAVRKDWPILRDILQKGMDALEEEEIALLHRKWVGTVTSPTSAASGPELSAKERTWISEHPVIRVHNELDWPPFNFNENGKHRGFSIDYMNLVASKTGLQVEYISGPSWNEFLEMMRAGELDVIANATPTDERREYMHFTSTFVDQPVAVVIDHSTTGINSLEDLRGRRVAVVEGFFQHEYMQRKYPEAELVLAKDVLGSLYTVLEGRADAMVAAFPSTKYLMEQHSLLGLRVAVISRDPESLSSDALAVRKDWPVLRDILQKGMDALDDKEVAALRQKWIGAESTQTFTDRSLKLTTDEKAWISDHPVIRVHNEMDWPPFNFNENGEPRGFSIDFMDLVASKAGLRLDYISGPSWNQFVEMIRTGELDVIANAAPTDERQEYMHFTSTFFDQPVAVVINDSTTGINSLEDLRGRRVAVVEDFFHHEYMQRRYPEAELVLAEDVLDALYAVLEGRADALVSSFPSAKYLMDQHALFGLRVAVISRDPELLSSIALAVRKDWPVLRDILQKGMDALDDNEITALRQKWIGAESPQTLTDGKLSLTAEEKAWISDHPVIRVHNEMDWPPFNFNENGEPRGFSIDFMNLVASRAGLQLEYISGPSWNQFVEMIRTGELDVIANATPTVERQEFMSFTSTFVDQPVAVVINDLTTGINSLEALRGRRVAVVEDFFHQEYMERRYPEVELVLVEDVLDSLYAVMEGRADALVSSFPVAKYLMDKHALLGLRVAFISRDPELMSSNALAVRKDWPVLRDILQKSMDTLDQEEMTALRQKWLGATREVDVQDSLSRTIIWLVGITLGVFLLLIVLNRLSSHYYGTKGFGLQTGTRRFRILILVALSIFVALVGIIGWLAQDYIKEKILQDVDNNLKNVLITTAQRLEFWVDQQANVLIQVAKNPTLLRQIELLLDVPADPETLLSSSA
ncbi:MAG: transporter substrate-binding domain-containing protein, partial [Xanthomonadales bacterium]|nr:transporter substrate-binding domain-containing protein [Xanthomonadales bacterium]